MLLGRFVKVKTVTVGRSSKKVTGVYSVMRKVNSDSADRVVYLWSPASVSVNRAYHKIRGSVKGSSELALGLRA